MTSDTEAEIERSIDEASIADVLAWRTAEGDALQASGAPPAECEAAFHRWWTILKERS
jgi:hypothetical protein